MTTPRIEEMVERLLSQQDPDTETYLSFNQLHTALTKAHQAGYADGYRQGKFDAEVTAEYGEPQEELQDNK